MLNNDLESVRFSREYAVLILRYMRSYIANTSYPMQVDSLDLDKLNCLARQLIQSSTNPSYGLAIGSALHISDYGAVGYAALSSANLLEALKTTIKFRNLVIKGIPTKLERTSDGYVYSVDCISDSPILYPLIELELAACIRFAKLCTQSTDAYPINIKRVSLKHCPIVSERHYQRVFGCPPTFNANTYSLVLPANDLEKPTHNPNYGLFKLLEDKLNPALLNRSERISFSDKVRAYIGANIPENFPSQEEAAQHFCLSVSGFKNRLKKEGFTFRGLVDEKRFKLAEQYIKDDDRSLKEIGYELGFSDQSAFNRAFKRWHGLNPGQFRATETDNS
jgi:AraC-like DNA-binding protein